MRATRGRQLRLLPHQAHDVAHRIIAVRTQHEIRGREKKEMKYFVVNMSNYLAQFTQKMTGGGGGVAPKQPSTALTAAR